MKSGQENKKNPASMPTWKEYVSEASRGEAFRLFCAIAHRATQGCKTRTVKLIGRRCSPQIYKTFLGYEIIGSRKRILCPDMTTARYLRIFSEIGLKDIELPYDVTHTQGLLPDLERAYASLQRIFDFFVDQLLNRHEKAQFLRGVYANLKSALTKSRFEEE